MESEDKYKRCKKCKKLYYVVCISKHKKICGQDKNKKINPVKYKNINEIYNTKYR